MLYHLGHDSVCHAGESNCNLPQLTAVQGQRARFHIFTLGTEDDLHSPSIQADAFVADVRPSTLRLLSSPKRHVLPCILSLLYMSSAHPSCKIHSHAQLHGKIS